jgi:hypothetical protein
MGLDASVRCRCWEDGRVRTPPPFAEHVRTDAAGYLRLDLPWAGHQDKHRAFDEWRQTCCAHEDMDYACEWVADWGSYRQFQAKLAEFGWPQFPTLGRVLPQNNDGTVSPEDSATALAELDDFARRDFGKKVVLVDAGDGEALHAYVPQYEGVFLWDPAGWEAGVDPQGFFVRRRHRGWLKWLGTREVFRSRRFTQERLGERSFLLRDERSGAEFLSTVSVSRPAPWPDGRWHDEGGRYNSSHPARLAVESRRSGPDEFDYILRPLRVVFRAAVETGNPVRWL